MLSEHQPVSNSEGQCPDDCRNLGNKVRLVSEGKEEMKITPTDKDSILAQLAAQEKLETSPAILSGTSEPRMVNTLDPRTEVSADARHVADKVVRHLWTIFVLPPIVSIILYEMAK